MLVAGLPQIARGAIAARIAPQQLLLTEHQLQLVVVLLRADAEAALHLTIKREKAGWSFKGAIQAPVYATCILYIQLLPSLFFFFSTMETHISIISYHSIILDLKP